MIVGKIKFKEILAIKSDNKKENTDNVFTEIRSLAVDSENNLFFLDINTFKIHKYNKIGKFVKSFGGKGNGPGEFIGHKNIALAIMQDTLYVSDSKAKKIIIYDKNGKYIRNILLSRRTPFVLKNLNRNKFVGLSLNTEKTKNEYFLKSNLSTYNKKFSLIKSLSTQKIKFDPYKPSIVSSDFIQYFDCGKNQFYVSIISEDRYLLKVYDLDSKFLFNIERDYRKVKMSNKEIEDLAKSIKIQTNNKSNKNKVETLYHKSINSIWVDKYDRVWVSHNYKQNNNEEEIYIDIFNNQGILISKFDFNGFRLKNKMNLNNLIYFEGDYLYIVDEDKNFNTIIRIFDY
ncbi:MAG: 6-bladed beta-propeller [Candidatus Delongbacteria bacterium]|nr:6-bladed beta-propeller [Candidatus Delongbacteria bacterium]